MNLLGQSLFKQMLAFRPADSVNENHLQPWWAPCTSESAGLPVVAKKNYHRERAKKRNTCLPDVLFALGRILNIWDLNRTPGTMKGNGAIGMRLKLVYVLITHRGKLFD